MEAVAYVLVHKLDHAHARGARSGNQRTHGRRDATEVLGNDRQLAEALMCGLEEVDARSKEPRALERRLALRDGVVRGEAQEMVETHVVVQLEHALKAGHPPIVPTILEHIPAEGGVAPQLAFRAKRIRWSTGLRNGGAILVDREDVAVRPHVGGVARHVHGHVTDDLDATAIGVGTQAVPLNLEGILDALVALHAISELLVARETGAERPVVLGPSLPCILAQQVLDGAERGVRRQPLVMLLAERLVLRFLGEILEVALAVLRPVHKHGVACEGGEARIRGTPPVAGIDRQDLPILDASLRQPVDKAL